MRILTWIIGLPLAAVAVAFAVANRQTVELDLWPLPISVGLSVYLAVLGALVVGLILGLLLGRATAGSRAAARARAAEVRAREAEAECARLRERTTEALPPPGSKA
ncbi:LapA family protein [Oleispirillum naphthae]|uniref:LapA family protein n=1 Tax=Oleispirillum naphthae TaxID=2838853 RepID=UPI0030825323